MCRVGTPEPAAIPAALLLELVTYGITAVIDVKERTLGPLEEQAAALVQCLVQPRRRVADERAQPLGEPQVFFGDGGGVNRLEIREHRPQEPVLVIDDPRQPIAKWPGMIEVADANPMNPADLVSIARTDPPARRPQMVGLRGRLFGQPLLFQVIGKDDVGPVTDVEPAADVDPLGRQRLDLLEQSRGVDHNPIADDRVDPGTQNPGRHQRELVSHAVDDDRVPRVGPSLITHDHVVPVAQQVDDFSLGLVTPLQTHHTRRTHGRASPVYQVDHDGHLVL